MIGRASLLPAEDTPSSLQRGRNRLCTPSLFMEADAEQVKNELEWRVKLLPH